ncbi:histidine kinase [bacterium SCSIO 12741]|nr:histidine kinase [bacterium SCSIO 12741]
MERTHFLNHLNLFLTFLGLVLSVLTGKAQEYQYEHFSSEDGLPSLECHYIIQDQKGYIWIATDQGIARYDGQDFKVFSSKDGLKNNFTFRLFEDGQGRIWFMTYDQMIYYIENDSLHAWPHNDKVEQVFAGGIGLINARFHDGILDLYLRSSEDPWTISQLDLQTGEISQFSLDHDNITMFLKDSFTYDVGVMQLEDIARDDTTIRETVFLEHPEPLRFDLPEFGQVAYDQMRVSGIINKKGQTILHILDNLIVIEDGEVIFRKPLKGFFVGTLFLENDSTFWEGQESTNPIRVQFSLTAGTVKVEEINLPIPGAVHFLKDRDGGVWINSVKKGVFYLPQPAVRKLDLGPFSNDVVSSIEVFGDRVFVSTHSGLLLQLDKESFSLIEQEKISERISDIIQFKGVLHIAGNPTISSWKPRADFHYQVGLTGFSNVGENLYTYNQAGYFEYSIDDREWIDVRNTLGEMGRVTAVAEYMDTLFIGGIYGIRTVKDNQIFPTSTIGPSFTIRDLKTTSQGLVMATAGGGLVVYDQGQYEIFNTENSAVISDFINHILLDGESIWLSTGAGIQQVQLSAAKDSLISLRQYSRYNGLPSGEVLRAKRVNNQMLVATKKGLCSISLNSKQRRSTPPIYLKSVKINGEPALLDKALNLTYKQNNLEIAYSSPSFASKGKTEYQYRLLGADDRFLTSSLPKATLLGLPAGEYTFEVYAINRYGLRSEQPATFQFRIYPVFWETWWFRIGASVVLILLVAGFVKMRLNQEKKNNEMLLSLNELKQKALNAQMNPHFIFNSLGSIQNLILDNRNDEAEFYLTRFSRLMRKMLNVSERLYNPLKDELSILEEYVTLENLRFNQAIEVKIEIEPGWIAESARCLLCCFKPWWKTQLFTAFCLLNARDLFGCVYVELVKTCLRSPSRTTVSESRNQPNENERKRKPINQKVPALLRLAFMPCQNWGERITKSILATSAIRVQKARESP